MTPARPAPARDPWSTSPAGPDGTVTARTEHAHSDAFAAPVEDTGVPGVELRLHDTTLYASIYRSDETLLANVHAFGAPAAQNPVLHLRRVPGGRVVDHYLTSFDRVWAGAKPVTDLAAVVASVNGR
jgi:hypothetical protein